MTRLRIGVHGATGRMGRMVLEEIARHADLELAWARGRRLPGAGEGMAEASPVPDVAAVPADVIVDFSTPEGLQDLLARAACPVVSGTTGLVPPQSPPVALLHAANFSLGIAVLAGLVRDAHARLPGWDVEVVELHHHHKRDAPSGTALRLVDGLGPTVSGRAGPRTAGEIGMHAVRGGDIVGEHRVYLCGPGERIELAHVAGSRALFAAGAVRCARWLAGKPGGIYTIEQVLQGQG